MLGITFHNPATISVYLDRMRFKDCFVSTGDVRDGTWGRKLKSFVELPSDGRDRVVFVESFATLQSLLQAGEELATVKVAVYDSCDVLARVPGATIVDAHINGTDADTWHLYTVSFGEFNDALAAQPVGVPALVRHHRVDGGDVPEPPKREAKAAEPDVAVEADEEELVDDEAEEKPSTSVLVMEQILDDIESGDDDDEDDSERSTTRQTVEEPDRLPEPAITAPHAIPGEAAAPADAESSKHDATEAPAATSAKRRRRKKKDSGPKLESYELF